MYIDAECDRRLAAWIKYEDTRHAAKMAHAEGREAALAEAYAHLPAGQRCPTVAEFDRIRAEGLAEYDRAEGAARAEYDHAST